MLLETERTLVRSFHESDINAYAKIVSDPEVMKYIGYGDAHTFDQAKRYLEDLMAYEKEYGFSRFAVISKDNRKLMGFCGYKEFNGDIDFGWRYAKEYWKQGYGFEVAHKIFEYGKTDLRLEEIVCISHPENKGSVRIIEKLGLAYIKTIRLFDRDVMRYVWMRRELEGIF